MGIGTPLSLSSSHPGGIARRRKRKRKEERGKRNEE
jgi:hypothetical protein